MLQEAIFNQYGIVLERRESSDRYQSFRSGEVLYTVIPLSSIDEEELSERLKLSQFMLQQGDRYVSEFILSNQGSYISAEGENLFLLLGNRSLIESRPLLLGRKLAKFHHRGRTYAEPIKKCNRIGKWKEMWEKRLDQLENVWRDKLHSHPTSEFEKNFVDSFPYYMSLGENAIQYLVDTEIDHDTTRIDAGTVCHERFHNELWTGSYCVKNPFDWVFDHGARDIAEWSRSHYFTHVHTYQPGLNQFTTDYRSLGELSAFSWSLTYARLLFPVHYFETIEEYYLNVTETRKNSLEEHLNQILVQSQYYEEFLKRYFEISQVPVNKYKIAKVDWL
jgi:spore coat protein YutH